MKKSWAAIACVLALPLFADLPSHPDCEEFCPTNTCPPTKKQSSRLLRMKDPCAPHKKRTGLFGREKTPPSRPESANGECKEFCPENICSPLKSPTYRPFHQASKEPCAPQKRKGGLFRTDRTKEKEPCAKPVCHDPLPVEETMPSCQITPPVLPNTRCGAGLVTAIDFIWWKSYFENTEYASSGVAGDFAVPFGADPERGSVMKPAFQFEPGFKIGFGTSLWHDGWDLFSNYTWLRGHDLVNSVSEEAGVGLIALFDTFSPLGNGLGLQYVSQASSQMSQNFNILDLELGRKFFISPRLILRPHFGLKAAWIHHTFQYDYTFVPGFYTFDVGPSSFTVINGQVKHVQNAGSIGIRSGLNSDWLIWKNLGIYGNVAISALWTDFHASEKHSTGVTGVGGSVNLNTRESVQEVIPVLELGLGLSYVLWFSQDAYRLEWKAGWEEQVWWNFNKFEAGNLTLQGLTTGLDFTF